ncbi:MAG TPA: PAS domain-containing protein [Kineosporiaceae bacterium]|nr:PAS domain-containing protein [Kineosporiaceae bacterium]
MGTDELFFSTTDRRGVIRAGNSVFVKISGYSVDELTGAPHSIIRHPDMPAAAFKIMWDRLHAGKPMGAYVMNLARDGKYYWVFSTVTPLGDGFLSVRMSAITPLLPAARRLYQELRTSERVARANGMSRAEAAAYGAVEAERGVRLLGFENYEQFMTEALPAEVAARAGLMTVRFTRQTGHGPVAEILAAAAALDHQLGTLVGRLDGYRDLSEALNYSSRSMLAAAQQLDGAAAAAREGSARISDHVKVLYTVAQAMVGPCHETVETLHAVVTELDSLRSLIAGLRFRIALARLHNDMVAAFASEVIDGIAPPSSLGEVPLICDALHEGVEHMAASMAIVNAKLASVAQAVARAGELFNDFRRFIGKWRLLVMRHRVAGELTGYIDPIDQMLSDGHDQLSELYALAQRCRAEIFPFEGPALDAQLARIRAAVASL